MLNYRTVWQVLVEHAGAHAREEESFLDAFKPDQTYPSNEYRFCGTLGFGGKYYRDNRIACYPEDLTPEREAVITKVNDLLKKMGAV